MRWTMTGGGVAAADPLAHEAISMAATKVPVGRLLHVLTNGTEEEAGAARRVLDLVEMMGARLRGAGTRTGRGARRCHRGEGTVASSDAWSDVCAMC
jgi:hypothetical protein